MIRVLVIHQQTADFENRALLASLACHVTGDAEVIQFQLPAAGAQPHTIAEISALNRTVGFDVLHAIGPGSLLAALPVGCQPIVYTPITHDPLRGLGRLRWISRIRPVSVATASEASGDMLRRAGVNAGDIRTLPSPFSPNVSNEPLTREQLGLAESDRVILAVGESTRSAGHKLAAWAAVVLFCLDPRHKLLISGGPYVDVIRRFAEALRQPGSFCIANDVVGRSVAFEQLVPAADVALFTPAMPCGLLAAQLCQAGDLPIIASPSRLVPELAKERLIVATDSRAKSVAQALHHFFDDDPNRAPVRGRPIVGAVNSVDPYLELYHDARVGRRAAI